MANVAQAEHFFAMKAEELNAKILDMNVSMNEAIGAANAMLNMRHGLWCTYGMPPDATFKPNPIKPGSVMGKGQAKGQKRGSEDVMGNMWDMMQHMLASKGKGKGKGKGGGAGGWQASTGQPAVQQDWKNKANHIMQVIHGRVLTKEDLVYTITSDEEGTKHSATLANTYDPSRVLQSDLLDSKRDAENAVAQMLVEWLAPIAGPLQVQQAKARKEKAAAKRARKEGQ